MGWGLVMKSVLWLLLGIVIGAVGGWYVRGLEQDVRASTKFDFDDRLADQQLPFLSATGSWRGGNLANKVNAVRITCDPLEKNCDVHQADVMSLRDTLWLSL